MRVRKPAEKEEREEFPESGTTLLFWGARACYYCALCLVETGERVDVIDGTESSQCIQMHTAPVVSLMDL